MQNKYKKKLFFLGIIITFLGLTIMTYYLWKIENKSDATTDNSCVSIIYSDEQNIDLINQESKKDIDGKNTQARSISITNKCDVIKTIQVYLNVLDTSTLGSNKIKAYINGDISLEPTNLENLKAVSKEENNILEKKLLYKYDLDPDKAIRLNIRLWKDEFAPASADKNIFHSTYEVAATNQIIKPTFKEKILKDNNVINSQIDYQSKTITDGLYKINNAYYFRGNVTNNYFRLDDYLFRVIGINADNSIKLVAPNNAFDTIYNEYANKEEMTIFNMSSASGKLDEWYQENLSKYDNYFVSGKFCSDSSYTKYYSQITYGGNKRLFTDFTPSLDCQAGDREYGGVYSSKVGILTADEMAISGLSSSIPNTNSYLFNGNDVCTSTPYSYYYTASIIVLNKVGLLGYLKANNSCTIMPVVNIDGHLTVKGEGTVESPYELDLED